MKRKLNKLLLGLTMILPMALGATSCNLLPLPGMPGRPDENENNNDNGNNDNGGNTDPDDNGNDNQDPNSPSWPESDPTQDEQILEMPQIPHHVDSYSRIERTDNFEYRVDEYGVRIIKYLGDINFDLVLIPDKIRGRLVYAIESGAFQLASNEVVVKPRAIYVPHTVKYIEEASFRYDDFIYSMEREIRPTWEDAVFKNEFHYTWATRPEELVKIDNFLFKYNPLCNCFILSKCFSSLKTDFLTAVPKAIDGIPVVEIGPGCFHGIKVGENVVLPHTIARIKEKAFYMSPDLASLSYEEGSCLEYIDSNAFAYNYQLKEVKLPNSIENIDSDAFFCDTIKTFTLPVRPFKRENSFHVTTIDELIYCGNQVAYDECITPYLSSTAKITKVALNNAEVIDLHYHQQLSQIKDGQLVEVDFAFNNEFYTYGGASIIFYNGDTCPIKSAPFVKMNNSGQFKAYAIVCTINNTRYLAGFFGIRKLSDQVVNTPDMVRIDLGNLDSNPKHYVGRILGITGTVGPDNKWDKADFFHLENPNGGIYSNFIVDNYDIYAQHNDEINVICRLVYRDGNYVLEPIRSTIEVTSHSILESGWSNKNIYTFDGDLGKHIIAHAILRPSLKNNNFYDAYLFDKYTNKFVSYILLDYSNVTISYYEYTIYEIDFTLRAKNNNIFYQSTYGFVQSVKEANGRIDEQTQNDMFARIENFKKVNLDFLASNFESCMGSVFISRVAIKNQGKTQYAYQGTSVGMGPIPLETRLPVSDTSVSIVNIMYTPVYSHGVYSLRVIAYQG